MPPPLPSTKWPLAPYPPGGDDASDPSYLDCEITLEPELFDVNLRDRLVGFFQQAFRRNPEERF